MCVAGGGAALCLKGLQQVIDKGCSLLDEIEDPKEHPRFGGL